MHSFMLVAKHSKCDIQKCQVDVTMLHISGCRSFWYDQSCKRCAACQDTVIFSECFYGYREIEWQTGGRGRVARIVRAERGAEGRARRGGGACSPPHHILVCAQPFTPALSTWRTLQRVQGWGVHGQTQTGRGGGHASGSSVRQEEGGCACEHRLRRTPSSGAQGKGSSPLCMWQTGGGNRRWHVQRGGGTATGEG